MRGMLACCQNSEPAGKQKVTFSMGGGSLLGASYPDAFFELVPVGTSAVYR
jgi:hypothetical protein